MDSETASEENVPANQVQIPKTFHFGHSSTKTFNRKKSSLLEQDKMLDELMESLPQS